MSKISKIAVPGVAEPYDIGTLSIPFGQVDSTSTDTAYTAQIEGITSLYDGVCVYLKNGVITSNKNGFTLNINSLGAKPVYDTLAAATRSGTVFNVDYTMLFVYNSSRVSGGCWDIFYGYNSDTTDLEEALTPLTGTTATLTPMQVYNAIKSGKSVILQYMDDTYGLLSYTNFNVAESMNVIVANTIAYFNNTYVLAELWGDTTRNVWGFETTSLAQKQDIPTKLPNPNALTFTGAVAGSYDGSEPVTVEIPGGGGNKGWTLLYDGAITIEEAVKTVTVSLLAPCEGMVDFIGHISWTANANTENGNDGISISFGKANMGYGRIGVASNAGNSVLQATVTSSRTYWGRANHPNSLMANMAYMQYGFSENANNANYENATIDFFAKTYAGTITLQLYGR